MSHIGGLHLSSGTECDSNRVGDVRRIGQGVQPADRLDRQLHLELGGVPVTGEALLDLGRRQSADGDSPLGCRQEYHPACVGHEYRGARVCVVCVEVFDRHQVRAKFGYQARQVGVDLFYARSDVGFGVGADSSAFDDRRLARR